MESKIASLQKLFEHKKDVNVALPKDIFHLPDLLNPLVNMSNTDTNKRMNKIQSCEVINSLFRKVCK